MFLTEVCDWMFLSLSIKLTQHCIDSSINCISLEHKFLDWLTIHWGWTQVLFINYSDCLHDTDHLNVLGTIFLVRSVRSAAIVHSKPAFINPMRSGHVGYSWTGEIWPFHGYIEEDNDKLEKNALVIKECQLTYAATLNSVPSFQDNWTCKLFPCRCSRCTLQSKRHQCKLIKPKVRRKGCFVNSMITSSFSLQSQNSASWQGTENIHCNS